MRIFFNLFFIVNLLDIIFTNLFWYAEVNPLVKAVGLVYFNLVKLFSIFVMYLAYRWYEYYANLYY